MTHLSEIQLQAFVLGMTGPNETDVIREHVSTCPTCAMRLTEEARLELLIQDVIGDLNTGSVPSTDSVPLLKVSRLLEWRPAWVSAVFLTMAVVFWLYLARYHPVPITAEDTYVPDDYCLFVGGQVDRIGLQAEFPDSAQNRTDIRP